MHYIAVLIPERKGWSVLFPDLPGCATQGESLDEAVSMAADALGGHLAVARDYGDEVPAPRSLEDIKADEAWCAENGVQWGKAMAAPILVRPPLGKPERVTISVDSNILREIDAFAEKRGQTRSSVLAAGAELLLGRDGGRTRRQALQAVAEEGSPARRQKELSAPRAGALLPRNKGGKTELTGRATRKPRKA
jgi:predicted RNase H-like HicB family nuclease/predicted transcriptional regulator